MMSLVMKGTTYLRRIHENANQRQSAVFDGKLQEERMFQSLSEHTQQLLVPEHKILRPLGGSAAQLYLHTTKLWQQHFVPCLDTYRN